MKKKRYDLYLYEQTNILRAMRRYIAIILVLCVMPIATFSEPIYSYPAVIRTYVLPNNATADLWVIDVGGTNDAWFIEKNLSRIGRIVSRNGTLVEWQLPSSNSTWGMVVENSSAIWISQGYPGRIMVFNPHLSRVKIFSVSLLNLHPADLLIDPEGRVWFVDPISGVIGYLNRSSSKVYTYVNSSASPRFMGSRHIAMFRDAIYASDFDDNILWELNITSNILTAFRLNVDYPANLSRIDVSADGTVWLAESGSTYITEFIGNACNNGTYAMTINENSSVVYTSLTSKTVHSIDYSEDMAYFAETPVTYILTGCFREWSIAPATSNRKPAAVATDSRYVWFVERNGATLGALDPRRETMASLDLSGIAGITGAVDLAVYTHPSFESIWLASVDGIIVEVSIYPGVTQQTVTETVLNTTTITVFNTTTIFNTTTETVTETETNTTTKTTTETVTTTRTATKNMTVTKIKTTTKTKIRSTVPDIYYVDFALGSIGTFLLGAALSYIYVKRKLARTATTKEEEKTETEEKTEKPKS